MEIRGKCIGDDIVESHEIFPIPDKNFGLIYYLI